MACATVSATDERGLTMASAHVVPSGASWQVKGNGVVVNTSSTQAIAISFARSWLKNNGGGELVIHATDGSIREKDTVYPGNDPRNVRG